MEEIIKNLKKRKHVIYFDPTFQILNSQVDYLLKKTWEVTPSKNNLMPYSLYVIGPDNQNFKDIVFNLCVNKENYEKRKKLNVEEYKKHNPNFNCIKSCSHLLIFTLRLEDNPSAYQLRSMQNGAVYECVNESTINRASGSAYLEIGMFLNTFSSLCLENSIDISYIFCFDRDLEKWKELYFIKRTPLILATIGKGKLYRRDQNPNFLADDLKPNYERIVNFV